MKRIDFEVASMTLAALLAATTARADGPANERAGRAVHGSFSAGGSRFLLLFPDSRHLTIPMLGAALEIGPSGADTRGVLCVEWMPRTTFAERGRAPETSTTEASHLSAVLGTRFRSSRRVSPVLYAGLSRQSAVARGQTEAGAFEFRDGTWSITLGADLDVRASGPLGVALNLRWDTDGGTLTYGTQIRAGLSLRARF